MTKAPKILFVQEVLGAFSEVFLYRVLTGMELFNIKVLTGNHVNRKHFPFDNNSMSIWDENTIRYYDKILPFINRTLKMQGAYGSLSKQIVAMINESDVDLVCFQFGFLPVQMGSDIHKIKKKVCIIHHGTDVNVAVEDEEYLKRLKGVWKRADKIIFSSHFLMKTAQNLGCSRTKSVVNYMGVPSLSRDNYINDIQESKPFRFICVGRMVPVKNHMTLIRAFSEFLKNTTISIELVLIGKGELEEDIENEINLLNIDKNVQRLGELNNQDVLSEIARSDCSILLSRAYTVPGVTHQEEALGLSLLEGGGMGLPMIGSRSGGIPEIVQNDINGYLVDPLDIEDIANAMLKIVSDPEKSKEMGENAKKLVEKKFDLSKQNKKFEDIFMDVIESEREGNK